MGPVKNTFFHKSMGFFTSPISHKNSRIKCEILFNPIITLKVAINRKQNAKQGEVKIKLVGTCNGRAYFSSTNYFL